MTWEPGPQPGRRRHSRQLPSSCAPPSSPAGSSLSAPVRLELTKRPGFACLELCPEFITGVAAVGSEPWMDEASQSILLPTLRAVAHCLLWTSCSRRARGGAQGRACGSGCQLLPPERLCPHWLTPANRGSRCWTSPCVLSRAACFTLTWEAAWVLPRQVPHPREGKGHALTSRPSRFPRGWSPGG